MATKTMAVRTPPMNKPRRVRSSIFVNGRPVYTTIAVQKLQGMMAKSVLEAEILLHLARNHTIDITV